MHGENMKCTDHCFTHLSFW